MKSSKFTSTPLFPRQALVALLLPLIAEQALSVTIGLADTLMVSSVGEAAVSGVSLVDSFNTLMIQIMSALATGGAVVTSQYIGHQEPKNAKAAAAQILFVLSSFSVLVAAVVIGWRHAILRGIFGSIDADVMHYAETYFLLSALSYPFIGLYNAGAALFRAQGNSKISMLSSLVMNVVNIGGNAVLIYGFGMGVMGAALASLVSRAIACAVVLYLLQKPGCALRVDSLRAMTPNGGLIRRILRVGIPAGIENGMFQIGKLSVSSLTSTLGTAAIAANAVANTTTTFLNIPANAVGMAALTVVGQCLGAGEKEQAVYYSRRLMLTAYCGAWVMNLSAFFFANRFAVSLFNLSPEAQAMALDIMVWFNIVSLFVWPSSFTLPNILRAAGDARFTMTVSIVSMWAFRVGFCYLAVLCFGGGLLSIVDGDVSGLGVPLAVLLPALPPGQLAGAECDLNFLASTPFPVCKDQRKRGGFFLFAGNRRSDSYYQQKSDGIFYKFHKLFFQHLTKFSPFVLAIFIVRAYNFSMLSSSALLQKEAIL